MKTFEQYLDLAQMEDEIQFAGVDTKNNLILHIKSEEPAKRPDLNLVGNINVSDLNFTAAAVSDIASRFGVVTKAILQRNWAQIQKGGYQIAGPGAGDILDQAGIARIKVSIGQGIQQFISKIDKANIAFSGIQMDGAYQFNVILKADGSMVADFNVADPKTKVALAKMLQSAQAKTGAVKPAAAPAAGQPAQAANPVAAPAAAAPQSTAAA